MGELARKPGCPEIAETPLELLTPRPGEGFTTFQKLYWPVSGTIGGILSAVVRNMMKKRPSWAGIHIHFLLGGVGFTLGTFGRDKQFKARSESDAILKHYISLHPDDFPPFERKRWRDVYVPFFPIR